VRNRKGAQHQGAQPTVEAMTESPLMTTVFNRPRLSKTRWVEGLLAAYGRYLEEVRALA